jgi:cytochrome d ubiquinol oxidase subunit II
MTLALLCAMLVWFALIAYGVLGGADFGGGIWDLLASGGTANRQREAIANAMGPVWEANNVWLIFVIVGAFTAFPVVFSSLSVALNIPLTLALIGIVLRGSAFVFRAHAAYSVQIQTIWGRVFSAASIITPFLLGMCAAAIADGGIRVHNGTVQGAAWHAYLTPFALFCGAFALSLSACLAATYLAVEAMGAQDQELADIFRWRAILAGGVAAVVGGLTLALASGDAPYLWHGLTHRALIFTIGAMLIGLATAFTLLTGRFQAARLLLMGEIGAILVAWAVAQAPYLIVPDVTIANAASPAPTLSAFLITSVLGLLLLVPSLALLFTVFKGSNPAASKQLEE